ncbi:MAG: tRNA epoxyqueuosine(34) reductase QueG [Oligoflexia bacterium]|nr:tRNA epoxyqueuosine(34) reductase QueG [Oligoflexia bacterium]
MNPMSIETEVKEACLKHFDLVGISPAQRPKTFEKYEEWLSLGRHGGLKYLERHREKKGDPQQLLQDAQSWISLFFRYDTNEPLSRDIVHHGTGWIARYARGTDYHELLRKKLDAIVSELQLLLPDAKFRTSVDIEPVMERDVAQQSGLGWIGKNTCLINQDLGSFGFLAEILTDAKLTSDKPAVDHCGTCTKCLDACPTGALIAPHSLDARLCISTWTIELNKEMPEVVARNLGNNLFGCDICQDVCPWNQKARKRQPPGVSQESGIVSLQDIIDDEPDKLKNRFAQSSLSRAKPEQLKRTAQILLSSSSTKLK